MSGQCWAVLGLCWAHVGSLDGLLGVPWRFLEGKKSTPTGKLVRCLSVLEPRIRFGTPRENSFRQEWNSPNVTEPRASILFVCKEESPDTAEGMFEAEVCPDAFMELMEELAVDQDDPSLASDATGKSPDERSDFVVAAPLTGEISRRGNEIFCGDAKCGSISYLVHWNPAAMAGNCLVHSNCYVTCPLLGADDDELIRWVGRAFSFRNAEEHGACRPRGAYHRRKPRVWRV